MKYKITYKDGKGDIVSGAKIMYSSSVGLSLIEDMNGKIIASISITELRSIVEVE